MGAAGCAVVAMTSALAGGYTPEPVAPVADNGFYIGGDLGYARQDYFDNSTWQQYTGVEQNNANNQGGFTGGVNLGYKINTHYAVELGWFDLPSPNVNAQGQASAYLSSWALYLAAKYMVPLAMSDASWYFKVGVAYRQATLAASTVVAGATVTGVTSSSSDYVRPMFATGLQYAFTQAFSGLAQYAYFYGANNSFPLNVANKGSLGTVGANVFTLGVAYNFTM